MGISNEQERLEELKKFSTFFDFISNPKQYQDLLTQVNGTLDRMEKIVVAHTKVEQAEMYLQAAVKKVEEVNAFVDVEMAKIKKAKDVEMALDMKVKSALLDREVKVKATETDLVKRLSVCVVREEGLDKRAAGITAQEEELARRAADLAEQQAQLNATRDKLTALLSA